jgi:hypothetical protein
MIFNTHMFSLFSHLWMYVSIYLSVYAQWIWTSCRQYVRAIRCVPYDDNWSNTEEYLKAIVTWTLRCALEAMIKYVWRCTVKPLLCEFGGSDKSSLQIHLKAMVQWTGRYTPMPGLSELWDPPGGSHSLNLEICWKGAMVYMWMHSDVVIKEVWRCACQLWSIKIGGVVGGSQSRSCWWKIH